jgi:hypothetical protein
MQEALPFQRKGLGSDCRYLFPVSSLTMRAAAWLASFRMWTRLKCLSNRPRISSLRRKLFPLSLNCTAGQDEHFPERSSSSGDEVITSSGLFTPLVSHRPEPISSPVDFKLHHCACTRRWSKVGRSRLLWGHVGSKGSKMASTHFQRSYLVRGIGCSCRRLTMLYGGLGSSKGHFADTHFGSG